MQQTKTFNTDSFFKAFPFSYPRVSGPVHPGVNENSTMMCSYIVSVVVRLDMSHKAVLWHLPQNPTKTSMSYMRECNQPELEKCSQESVPKQACF